MNKLLFALTLLASATLFSAPALANDAGVVFNQTGPTQMEVRVNGEHFTTYHFSNEERKPYLWPVLSEGQFGITRDWPMDRDAAVEGQTSHPHHKSFYTAYGDLNGVDCWAEGSNAGWQQTDTIKMEHHADGSASLIANNTWTDVERKPVIAEDREYRFYPSPASARVFDVTVTFTAKYGDVKFGDTKEGGIVAYRMRPGMQTRGGNGVMTLSTGETGAGTWGKPAEWCDYSAEVEDVGTRGIAIFDNPQNLRHPTRWHIRDYGLNGANCFGLSDFTNKQENGDYMLEDGESLTFKYRVIIHSGGLDLNALYAEYAAAYK